MWRGPRDSWGRGKTRIKINHRFYKRRKGRVLVVMSLFKRQPDILELELPVLWKTGVTER